MALRFEFHAFVFVCLGLGFVPAGCATKLADGNGAETETGDGDTGDGDGDGDPGDGDGDPETGDGDGDPETGDGDGDPETGDGDGDPETGDGDGDALPDATYLLAIQTSLGPDLPLQFVLDVFNLVQTNDGATADFVMQPLSLAQGWTVPGECLGPPLQYEGVSFDIDGNFVLDMGLVMISGEANPVTGSDMEVTMVLHGHTVEPDAMCGDMTGMLTSPLEYDLIGSTFAAIPLAGGCDADPFPAPIYTCSML